MRSSKQDILAILCKIYSIMSKQFGSVECRPLSETFGASHVLSSDGQLRLTCGLPSGASAHGVDFTKPLPQDVVDDVSNIAVHAIFQILKMLCLSWSEHTITTASWCSTTLV